ncbi:MAG TPA: hypothetical protein VNT26_00865, partial [Candidatus Sulfotelmatobacter sp.]|nr:hypothetical protein [Candidatus Sulfotelmatobacter sp.]
MRKLILLTAFCAALASCNTSEEYIVIKLQVDCFGTAISQLDDAIITSKYSDLGASGSGRSKFAGVAELLAPKTIYRQNLKRHSDGYFYIDSVPK